MQVKKGKKILETKDVYYYKNFSSNYTSLLNSISDSIITNVDQKSVTRLIKNQLDENPSWSIETLSTEGTDAYKPTYSTGNQNVYVMEPKLESVTNAKNKLKEILNTN